MTIQEELNQVRIQKQREDIYKLFKKLNNICKEESDMDIYEVLKQYDILSDNAFSIIWKLTQLNTFLMHLCCNITNKVSLNVENRSWIVL